MCQGQQDRALFSFTQEKYRREHMLPGTWPCYGITPRKFPHSEGPSQTSWLLSYLHHEADCSGLAWLGLQTSNPSFPIFKFSDIESSGKRPYQILSCICFWALRLLLFSHQPPCVTTFKMAQENLLLSEAGSQPFVLMVAIVLVPASEHLVAYPLD